MKIVNLVIVSMFLVMTAAAQSGPTPKSTPAPPVSGPRTRVMRSDRMQVELPPPMAETPVPVGGPSGDGWMVGHPPGAVSPGIGFDSQIVTDLPFSAESVTEHVQTLGDGNRLVRRSSATIYRDHQGRTRRDHMEEQRGGSSSANSSPVVSVINDPVAHTSITLDHRTSSATKMELPPEFYKLHQQMTDQLGEPRFGVLVPRSVGERLSRDQNGAPAPDPAQRKTEKLESRMIEGVLAEGTRTTLVIPAGEFDNEQPLEITHERWYSPELKAVVLMRHNDPRFGETTFRLTNINRNEPEASLFQIPANYKVKERGRGSDPLVGRRPPGN